MIGGHPLEQKYVSKRPKYLAISCMHEYVNKDIHARVKTYFWTSRNEVVKLWTNGYNDALAHCIITIRRSAVNNAGESGVITTFGIYNILYLILFNNLTVAETLESDGDGGNEVGDAINMVVVDKNQKSHTHTLAWNYYHSKFIWWSIGKSNTWLLNSLHYNAIVVCSVTVVSFDRQGIRTIWKQT